MRNKKNSTIMAVITLVLVGIVMVYSSSRVWANFKFGDPYYFAKRQLVFALIGFVCMFLCSRIDLLKYRKYNPIIFVVGIVLLLLVLVPGLGVLRNGSRSWFSIGTFLFQPSEVFKIIIILCVSDYLSKKKKIEKCKDFMVPLGLMMLGFLLILLQPDFGSGIVMVGSVLVILFCASVPLRYFGYVLSMGGVAMVGLIASAPYRMERILSFLNPWADPLGSGFQIIQSLYAIGPGGLFGGGLNGSIQKQFYLPEPQTDFIFAIFGEEFGFIGCLLLLGLFLYLIYNGISIALSCESLYLSYISIGLISLFAIQVMINLGVVVGLFPVTGITLPLLSYGGSSLIVMLSCFGILLSNIRR